MLVYKRKTKRFRLPACFLLYRHILFDILPRPPDPFPNEYFILQKTPPLHGPRRRPLGPQRRRGLPPPGHAHRRRVRGDRPFQSRSQIQLHPPALLPNPGCLLCRRRRRFAPAKPRSQNGLPPHRPSGPSGHPLSFPGPRFFPRRHRPKNPPAAANDQPAQRRTHHCRFPPAKKNSPHLIPPPPPTLPN